MLRLFTKLIYSLILLIQALVSIRFVLLLIDASAKNSLVNLVYQYSEYFVRPFRGITQDVFVLAGVEFDLTSLVALAFFIILGYITYEMVKAFSRE
ncbi:MAG: hypothetical protein UT34_C0001G0116 [candidate division WS6 bacterium GW2011_GWF2_39_15]|uniref:YGGT family protein n=1 Tax=candidate division WS6 bacterium GW2011_GWF2_39_15 TaxID=1619100 RepID=A0A0G0MZR6_9BACT|nr:MAG: hypothetical protein UT34_C0001G0116 [candidate division WS6 bacterium GW2011_GWF2_39_15]